MMNTDKLAEMLAAATPGPWHCDPHTFPCVTSGAWPMGLDVASTNENAGKPAAANAALIAQTPDLAAEVLRLRAKVDQLTAANSKMAEENARLVTNKREVVRGMADIVAQLLADLPMSRAVRSRFAAILQELHAFLAGEGK